MERLEGVREAAFSYPEGRGVVTYDTATTSVEAIVAELERVTGFSAIERSPNGG